MNGCNVTFIITLSFCCCCRVTTRRSPYTYSDAATMDVATHLHTDHSITLCQYKQSYVLDNGDRGKLVQLGRPRNVRYTRAWLYSDVRPIQALVLREKFSALAWVSLNFLGVVVWWLQKCHCYVISLPICVCHLENWKFPNIFLHHKVTKHCSEISRRRTSVKCRWGISLYKIFTIFD